MQVAAKLQVRAHLAAEVPPGRGHGARPARRARRSSTLRFTPKKGAELVRKVLESAIANAENNHERGHRRAEGRQRSRSTRRRVLKRFHARAKGRGNRIVKRNSHITDHSSATAGRAEERTLMGQKVNPIGIRLGITRDWTSKWYADTRSFPALRAPGLAGARVPEEEARRSLGEPHSHRARRPQGQHHDPHRPSGRRDRQEGRGHRDGCASRSRR